MRQPFYNNFGNIKNRNIHGYFRKLYYEHFYSPSISPEPHSFSEKVDTTRKKTVVELGGGRRGSTEYLKDVFRNY